MGSEAVTGYPRTEAGTGTLTPFQVPDSPTSAAPPFHSGTDTAPMLLAVVFYFVALVAAIAAVGRTLAPPALRHLDAELRPSR